MYGERTRPYYPTIQASATVRTLLKCIENGNNTMSNDKKKKKSYWNQKDYPYKVDYNDHFETPLSAYQDIAPLLDWLAQGKTRKEQRIYDPYYCNGATTKLMKTLGFEGIIHEKRDFYQDVEKKR